MAASFPVTLPSAVTTVGTNTLDEANHNDDLHVKDRDEIRALGTKLGLGSSVASSTTVLVGTGGTTSAWGQIGPQHIAAGSVTLLRLGGTTLAGTVASVEIVPPTGYRHLKVVGSTRTNNAAATSLRVRFNSDSGSNYYSESIFASATTVSGIEELAQTSGRIGVTNGTAAPSGAYAGFDATIYDYTSTTRRKSLTTVSEIFSGTASTNFQNIYTATSWAGTAAIGTITILPGAGSFIPGTSFDLYGLPG